MRYKYMEKTYGSIRLHGEKRVLFHGDNDLGNGLIATLECRKVSDRAVYQLLRIRNNGNENSVQITEAKTLDWEISAEGTFHYHSLQGDDCGASSFMPKNIDLTESYTEQPLGGRSSGTTGFPYLISAGMAVPQFSASAGQVSGKKISASAKTVFPLQWARLTATFISAPMKRYVFPQC